MSISLCYSEICWSLLVACSTPSGELKEASVGLVDREGDYSCSIAICHPYDWFLLTSIIMVPSLFVSSIVLVSCRGATGCNTLLHFNELTEVGWGLRWLTGGSGWMLLTLDTYKALS